MSSARRQAYCHLVLIDHTDHTGRLATSSMQQRAECQSTPKRYALNNCVTACLCPKGSRAEAVTDFPVLEMNIDDQLA